MNEKRFTCNGIDWYFLKTFAFVEEGTGLFHENLLEKLRKNTKKLHIAIMLIMILAFGLVIWGILQMIPASQFKSNMNLVFIIITISLVIGAFLMWLGYAYKYVRINKSAVLLPNAEEEITLYKVTQDGIYLNLYNRTDKEQMIFLEWRKVKSMNIDNMRYLPRYINPAKSNNKQVEKELHRIFNNMKKKLDNFPYEPKFKYDNVHSVYLLHRNEQYISQLPIPASWHENGIYDHFITELKPYVDYGPESVLDRFID